MSTLNKAIKAAREGPTDSANLSPRQRNMAELGVRRIVAAGYRILAPGALDPVTLEKAAHAGWMSRLNYPDATPDELANTIRALNTGGE